MIRLSEEALETGRPFSAPVPGQSLTNSPDVGSTFNTLRPNEISPTSVTPKVREMIEEIDVEQIRSLLSKPEENKEEPNRSLLEAGE